VVGTAVLHRRGDEAPPPVSGYGEVVIERRKAAFQGIPSQSLSLLSCASAIDDRHAVLDAVLCHCFFRSCGPFDPEHSVLLLERNYRIGGGVYEPSAGEGQSPVGATRSATQMRCRYWRMVSGLEELRVDQWWVYAVARRQTWSAESFSG
jgi:hypothetical protein